MCKKLQKCKKNNKKLSKKRKICKNNVKKRIKMAIHPLTLVFAFISILCGKLWLFLIYFSSILLHELCHAKVAKKLGYVCDKITLYPSGALLSGNTDEFTFLDEVLVGLAGPLCNVVLCIMCVFLWWICPEIYNYTADFVVANLSIAIFNLLPIFPLDGGRVLLAVLSSKLSRKTACKIAKKIALFFSLMLFMLFIVSLFFVPNFQIGICSVVIFISSVFEDKEAVYKRVTKSDLKRRKLKHGLKVVELMFSAYTPIKKVMCKIDNFAYYKICVVDNEFNILATFSEEQFYKLVDLCNVTDSLSTLIGLG